MRDFSTFQERMDHEFSNVTFSLVAVGYKVDGTGIKDCCHLNKFKSVDYFYSENSSFYLLEFSDLYRQRNDLLGVIASIKSSNLEKKTIRRLIKQEDKKIHTEFVGKFKDTCYILKEMSKSITGIPAELLESKQNYLIVISPVDRGLPIDRQVDLIKYIDNLKDRVASAIPDVMFKSIKLVDVKALTR